MIQRIQTIYLLLACAFGVAQVVLTACHITCVSPDVLGHVYVGLVAQTSLCLAAAIFLYGNRKRQMKVVSWLTAECLLLSLAGLWLVMHSPSGCRILSSAIIFPLIVAAFSCLARRAISSDERKVRAADRIR